MNSNTRVKECPYRLHENHALRGTNEPDAWMNRCAIQAIPEAVAEGSTDVFCHLHGNSKLNKCEHYNDHIEKELREAFKKLDDLEKHRDVLRAVMNM